jgi:hypothetical protein
MLLLTGQMGEAWESSKSSSFSNQETLTSTFQSLMGWANWNIISRNNPTYTETTIQESELAKMAPTIKICSA